LRDGGSSSARGIAAPSSNTGNTGIFLQEPPQFPNDPIVKIVQPSLTLLVGHRQSISTDQHNQRISRLCRLLEHHCDIGTTFDPVDNSEDPGHRQSNCPRSLTTARRILANRYGDS